MFKDPNKAAYVRQMEDLEQKLTAKFTTKASLLDTFTIQEVSVPNETSSIGMTN